MHAIWGAHMMSLTKLIVVVDADCDVHDLHEVAWRALGNTDYARDLTVVEGPVDHLDHASYQQFWGGKAGIDATRKLPEEGYTRDGGWPEMVVSDPRDGGEGRPPVEGVRPVSARVRDRGPLRARSRPSRRPGQGLPAAGDDRALGLRAALRLHRRADRDVRDDAQSTGASCCWSPSRWWGCAPSRWPATGSSTARSTPATRAPPSRELVTGAVSVRYGVDRRAGRRAWSSWAPRPLLNPLCLALAPVAVIPMVVYPYGKRFTELPARHPGPRPGDGPDRRLARGHRRLVVGRGDPRARGRHLDRRLRPDLRLPGRGGGPRARRASRCRPASASRPRSTGRPGLPCRHHGPARLVRRGHRTRACSAGSGLAIVAGAFVYEHHRAAARPVPRSTGRSSRVNGFIGIALFVCALLDLLVRGLGN